MVTRQYWKDIIERAWGERSVVWLHGVRRVGKTCLCRSLDNVVYFDCELPRTRRMMEDDPEAFLESMKGKVLALDEIHRLRNPAELLKIAADYFPSTRIIATGSSTLGASKKFRDTLTGRKAEIWVTPMISDDLQAFGPGRLNDRLLKGGLPPMFLSKQLPERDFEEWMDSYWAKDIQELFRIERKHSFQRFLELLLTQSSGVFEANSFAGPCEVSRTTIANYLSVLESTSVAHVIRPFGRNRAAEIVAAPKVYGFDTGFVCHHKGWSSLRRDDMGLLWEHYVLNEIHGKLQRRDICYWRDKRQHEIDFVFKKRGRNATAIECKWSAAGFSSKNMEAFRRRYPDGDNYVVCGDVDRTYRQRFGNSGVTFVGLAELISAI